MAREQLELWQELPRTQAAPCAPIRLPQDSQCKPEFQPVVLAEVPPEVAGMPEIDLEDKIAKTIAVLKWALQNFEICFSYSGGKDSSTVLALGLAAAAQMRAEGTEVKRFLVLNSNTLVESPAVLAVVQLELSRIRAWIRRHQLPGHVEVTTPSILNQFAVSIIGGKSIISTPATNRNCTTDLKSVPLTRARTRFFGKNKIAEGRFTVGVTGVRFGESAERTRNLNKRAESATQVVQTDAQQNVFLAPIARWNTDNVMEFIGLAVNDLLPVEIYSNFKDVWRIYKDAEGECSVGRGDKPSKNCSARHGCYVCTMVSDDKSMDGFLANDDYAYMRPLAQFREYQNNTVFDLSKRTWVGRSIEQGHIVFAPDAYNAEYLQDLLKFALSIDATEQLETERRGSSPRFRIVSPEALIAIDAMWSLQGFGLPHATLNIYNDVYENGVRYKITAVSKAPKTPLPALRYIPVGEDWGDDEFAGLRDVLLELAEGPCSATRLVNSGGEKLRVMDVQVGELFTVDSESADMVLTYELDRLLENYRAAKKLTAARGAAAAGQGYRFYLHYGTISLARNQVGTVDRILRRTAWRERIRLASYNYDHGEALARSVEVRPAAVVAG